MVTLKAHQAPTENVHHTENETVVNVDGADIGAGTMFITESHVVWLNANGQGLELEYQGISLHAVSRDLTSFPHQHLLCHYEKKLPGYNSQPRDGGDDNEQDMDDEEIEGGGDNNYNNTDVGTGDVLIDIKFIPQNPSSLDGMFKAMSDCQLLHPDPDDDCISEGEEDEGVGEEDFDDAEVEEDGDENVQDAEHVYESVHANQMEGGFFTGDEGLDHLTEEGRANLARFNAMLVRSSESQSASAATTAEQVGQGDGDLSSRTSQMTISNGHSENGSNGADQFQDADEMN